MFMPLEGFGQRLGFVTSTPRIDSFPIVRLKMTATYNGLLPQPGILPTDLKVTEDNFPENIQLIGCDESAQAAVVFCVDASTSIKASAGDSWDIYLSYYKSFDKFINLIPSASRYALVVFTDQAQYFPGPAHLNGFYSGQNAVDSSAFQNILRSQTFTGFTNIDPGIDLSISLLQNQPFKQKAIVLVTDDAIYDTPYYDSLMNALGITLYVMELGKGSPTLNAEVTHNTGGVFMTATDSAQYPPVMSQLGEFVFGEHCNIRYVSTNPCPWLKLHSIGLTLNYKTLQRNITEQYILGRNIFDFDPPLIAESSPVYTSRSVQATENFPCTRGIRDFHDSLLQNFIKLSQVSNKYPNFASDSLIVNDTMQPARAVYRAIDSANNKGRKEILYTPKADILPPVIDVAQSSGGNYQMILTESRAWDKGLNSASLKAGAQNLILDSVSILTRRFGEVWLHSPNPSAAASGCLEAYDSSGNMSDYCIKRDSATGDTLPPIISQFPVVSPRLQITGAVDEKRFKDIGLKNITIFPAPNTGASKVTFLWNMHATFSVPILDSLQPVRALIVASDSVGNAAHDTLRYDPLPDNTSPVCSIEIIDQKTRVFHVVELAPWDRGVRSVILVGASNNFTFGPVVFTDVYHAEQKFTLIDPFLSATAVMHVVDSVGHICETTIAIDPLAKPLIPFTSSNVVDFGTQQAPANMVKSFQVRNPNESPVVVTKIKQTGDVSIFSSDMTMPIVFQPFETKSFNMTFSPSLLGNWQSDFALANDTMNLTSVKAIGRTIGNIFVTVDTVNVPYTQVLRKFHVAISATPAPINLDTISFVLSYDADLALLQNPQTDCSGGNPLCNYLITPTNISYGKIRYDLYRKDRSVNNTLSFVTSSFDVPFICYVSKKDTTAVLFEDLFVSQLSTSSSSQGMITVGNQCGDVTLRAYLNGNLPAVIKSVVPNPANTIVTVSILSVEKTYGQISLVNNLGVIKLRTSLDLESGLNPKILDISSLPSGSYQLILSRENGILSVQTLAIVK